MNPLMPAIEQLITEYMADDPSSFQYLTRDELASLQKKKLQEHVHYAFKHSPFYRDLFEKYQIHPERIKGPQDLSLIPCTDKSDLIHHNEAFLAVPSQQIADVCLTSATSGEVPALLLQTHSDLARLAYNEKGAFQMTGLNSSDSLMVCAALDRAFMAGLAYFLGGLSLKTRVIRAGSGSAAQHWQMLKVTHPTAIVGVPSLMRKIAEYALECREDPRETSVKKLIAIGEPVRDKNLQHLPLTASLEELWSAQLYSTYASTELATTYCECEQRQGGHIRPELIVTEIVDQNNQPVADGEVGEVVVTPLGVEGMPLIRFKTGDISFMIHEPCSCGRNTPRLGPILGRKNQMLKFKGTTLFPNSILSVLEGIPFFEGGYIQALQYADGTDRIQLHVAVKDARHDIARIEELLRAKIRVVPEIVINTKEEIEKVVDQPEKKRKRITFIDSRPNPAG